MLLSIPWDVSPEIFSVDLFGFHFAPRWYGLLFALGFLIGQQIMFHIYRKEGKPESDVETLTIYMVLATVIGARLGHCLFYEPEVYLSDPIKILKIWEGGLASHGATIGILFGLYLYSRKKKDQLYLWVVDRIVITVALAGMFIRLGNLMNSEIYGHATDLPWGFRFVRETDPDLLPIVPRHPTQIYEALFCLILFLVLYRIWNKRKSTMPNGLLLGIFLVALFTFRFFVEFLKEPQVEFENNMLLNMGQLLSIPAALAGFLVLAIAQRNARRKTQVKVG